MIRTIKIAMTFATLCVAACTGNVVGLYLVAHDEVPVFDTEKEAMTSHSPEMKLTPLQRVPVIECVDVKHYLIYKIRLQNGKEGYVNEGKYSLERDGKPSTCTV